MISPKQIMITLLLLALPSLQGVQAADDGWVLEKDKAGVQVYSKVVEGSSIKAVRGVTILSASLNRLVSILHDPAQRPRWDERCGEAYQHKRLSDSEELVYIHTKLPWPVKDRDLLTRVHWSQDPATFSVSMRSTATDGIMPAHKNRVRVTTANYNWDLFPLGNGKIRATLTAHADPAGPIPAWLINQLSVESPYTSLKNINRIITSDSFKHREFDFIREPAEG